MRPFALTLLLGFAAAACKTTPEAARIAPGYKGIERVSLYAKGME